MNDNIKKMADLLRSGNTMLNMACPVCNQPIFRNKDGHIFCPTCNRQVLIVNGNHDAVLKTKKEEINHGKEKLKVTITRHFEILKSLEEVIFEKIDVILGKLRNETHLQMIEVYTKVLLNCLEILNKIPAPN
jgi:uncharacterized Zn finger protein (UPF0148 family)